MHKDVQSESHIEKQMLLTLKAFDAQVEKNFI